MKIKVAAAQTDPKLGNIDHNLEQTKQFMQEAGKNGAQLIAFPECSLTGYCYNSKEESMTYALDAEGSWVEELRLVAQENNIISIVGFVEKADENLYNSSLVIGPEGVLAKYRKVHLPELGVDPFVQAGENPIQIIPTPIGNIGILICYDVRFPEQSRILALQGADLLIHLTNIPLTGSGQIDYLLPARAEENHIYVLSSDRVGEERGFRFLGRSSIFGVNGDVLTQANDTDETIIYATLDLHSAQEKNVFYPAATGKPVEHTNRLFESRRPDLYQGLNVNQPRDDRS